MTGPVVRRIVTLLLVTTACGRTADVDVDAPARAVPRAQSASAQALRLPRMRPALSRMLAAGDLPVTIVVDVRYAGEPLRDSVIRIPPAQTGACGVSVVDSSVARNGDAVTDAVVWIEGPASTLMVSPRGEYRPTVRLAACRMLPRLQVAAPGSTLLLVTGDSMAASMVVVPPDLGTPVDTVPFLMEGQLVPLQHRADSIGMLAVYALPLQWARAFVAILPPSSGAITDVDGRAQFMVDGRARVTTVRAWHPSLGVVSARVPLKPTDTLHQVTLTFRR